MEIIVELTNVFRTILIPTGVTFRVIFCLIKMMYSEDEVQVYKKRMITVIVFGLVAELMFVIKDVILWYYN